MLRELGGLSLKKRRLRGTFSLLTGGGSRGQGESGSAPREQGQDKGKHPQAAPWEDQVGHQEEFLHRMGGQALEQATREVVVFKKQQDVAMVQLTWWCSVHGGTQ